MKMMLDNKIKNAYTTILKEELIPAMGCTEPIAITYAGAIIKKNVEAITGYVGAYRQRK